MGFFDNVKNSFTETSQDLTKKAKDTTEIFRLNNLNKTKEKEIEKVIYQIGLAFYSNKKDECTAMFPELMAQVETLQKEIAENKETIERLSTEEICPNCGKIKCRCEVLHLLWVFHRSSECFSENIRKEML